MCLLDLQSNKWVKPAAQEGIFTPEGGPNFLEVEWEFDGTDCWIIDVTIHGKNGPRSIKDELKDSDIEALREEAMTMVEGGVL